MNNKILCVDDEESILRGFKLNLRKDFDVHLASNGVEGLEVFEQEKDFAVVLSDMRMPEMDGATMLSEIKKRNHEVVTILLTGHTDFESQPLPRLTKVMFFECFRNLALLKH